MQPTPPIRRAVWRMALVAVMVLGVVGVFAGSAAAGGIPHPPHADGVAIELLQEFYCSQLGMEPAGYGPDSSGICEPETVTI